jgi:hypothetical protein
VMLWIAWLDPGRLSLPVVLVICGGGAVLGLWLAWRRDALPHGRSRRLRMDRGVSPLRTMLAVAAFLVAAGLLVNAAYWPFSDWDALAIYAPLAKRIFEHGALPTDSIYAGYPMLLPLAYAYTHWIAGAASEQWARLVPAATAIGGIAGAAALAGRAAGSRAGTLAAGLVALTPLYGRWATSGYTDVTVGFFFILCALYAWRWRRSAVWSDAVLAGVFGGLAMWTKNDALTLLVSLPLLVLLAPAGLAGGPHSGRQKGRWVAALLVMVPIVLIAAPWYVRNIVQTGSAVPPTIWLDQAQPSVASALVLVRPDAGFGAPGWLFLVGLVYGIYRIFGDIRNSDSFFAPMVVVVPYFGAWWLLASYDSRFMVTLVPILAVLASLALEKAMRWLASEAGDRLSTTASWSAALLVLLLLPAAINSTVKRSDLIIQDPRMAEAARHRAMLGGVYDLAMAINRLPAGSSLLGVPAQAMYYVDQGQFDRLSSARAAQPPWNLAPAFDFVIYNFRGMQRPMWLDDLTPAYETDDGYALFSTMHQNDG